MTIETKDGEIQFGIASVAAAFLFGLGIGAGVMLATGLQGLWSSAMETGRILGEHEAQMEILIEQAIERNQAAREASHAD